MMACEGLFGYFGLIYGVFFTRSIPRHRLLDIVKIRVIISHLPVGLFECARDKEKHEKLGCHAFVRTVKLPT